MARRALGRGIDALLGGQPPADPGSGSQSGGIVAITLTELATNDQQPRKSFDDAALEELAASIRQFGVLQPVLVERVTDGYRIIAGERRCRAARLAGLTEVPAVVRDTTSRERLEIALIENVQREDLTPIEEAEAYSRLLEAAGVSQEELARRVGKRRSTVTNSLRLLKLPQAMQSAISDATLSAGHARALLMVEDHSERQRLFRRILDEGLSVRQSEEAASRRRGLAKRRAAPTAGSAAPSSLDPDLASVQQELIDLLGTKVVVRGSTKEGSIEITYFSLDELNRVIDFLRSTPNPRPEPQ